MSDNSHIEIAGRIASQDWLLIGDDGEGQIAEIDHAALADAIAAALADAYAAGLRDAAAHLHGIAQMRYETGEPESLDLFTLRFAAYEVVSPALIPGPPAAVAPASGDNS